MDTNLGMFNNDIYREIITAANITTLLELSSVCKYFNIICNEKCILIDKFYCNNLIISNDDLITIREYVNEYCKLAYSEFMPNCLLTNLLSDCKNENEQYLQKIFTINAANINDVMLFNILPKDICEDFKRIGSSLPTRLEKRDICLSSINDKIKFIFKFSSSTSGGSISVNKWYENFDEIVNFFRKILYYYPDIEINFVDISKVIGESYKTKYWNLYCDQYNDKYF
jgi:hypothetical protein